MSTDVITVTPDTTATDAWRQMQRHRIRHLVVMDGARLVGLVSERDLGGPKGTAVRRGRSVRELMSPQVAAATPDTTLRQAANLMRGRTVGSLPVLEDGRVVGIVTATDVLDELGRGATRPVTRAQRRDMRLPPASARRAAAKAASRPVRRAARAKKAVKRGTRRGGTESAPSPGGPALPARLPRPAKRAAGRTGVLETPAYIRADAGLLDDAGRDYLRRKLARKLGKFAPSIERVSVRLEDVNGPRGGVDKRCQIKVVLSGLPSVVVDERQETLPAVMERALDRIERAVRLRLERRRRKPIEAHARAAASVV